MSFTLTRSAAGFALLAALAAGCGTAAAAHHAAVRPKPAATAPAAPPAAVTHHHPPPPGRAPPGRHAGRAPAHGPAHAANPIPQGNGGDQDADNNGGPSDGDGNIQPPAAARPDAAMVPLMVRGDRPGRGDEGRPVTARAARRGWLALAAVAAVVATALAVVASPCPAARPGGRSRRSPGSRAGRVAAPTLPTGPR